MATGRLDPVGRVFEVELPAAKILSVKLIELEPTFEDQSWLTSIGTDEAINLARQNGGEGHAQLDRAELLRAADLRLRERLRAAMAGTGVQLRLAEPAG